MSARTDPSLGNPDRRVAVVTGAGRGIGAATATLLQESAAESLAP